MAFRKDFIWGAATAAYQVEGAAREGGRGSSIWDEFSHTPGKVYRGHTGDVACDHYHRVEDDVRLMAELGIRNYRFSISWTRLLPEGTGAVNPEGVAFYNKLIDTLVKYGIRPFITLFHWDYPSALYHKGGWRCPESVGWFREYAALVAKSFGDRVKDFITINEPQCILGCGHENCQHAPGECLSDAELVLMSHHMLLAHGEAVRVLRELVPGCRVSYAPCGNAAIPATETPADIEAARKAYFDVSPNSPWTFNVSWWSDPALLGSYPEKGLSLRGHLLPKGWEQDLLKIHQPLDYYCQNIYNGTVFRAADNERGYEVVPSGTGHPRTCIGWDVTPEALYWGPRFLCERYHTPFVISENGMSAHDWVSLDGKVHDPNRIDYMHRYLQQYRRAADEGYDLRGYFAWSLMDNFEWAYGYSERFGMIYVDYATQQRIPKDSALWYRGVMESNGENL